MNYGNRKRRQEANITTRLKQPRGNVRPQIEDVLPFECPQLDSISPEIKHYINELEREFIERYNILISNRIIYGEITEKYIILTQHFLPTRQ